MVNRGLTVEQDDPAGQVLPLYSPDGQQVGSVPLAPDPGFATNPGAAWEEDLGGFLREKISRYPSVLQQVVIAELLSNADIAILLTGFDGAEIAI